MIKITGIKYIALLLTCLISSQTALAFGPCSNVMPGDVSYLPSVKQCGGRAGIVLSGKFLNAFSVVLRTCNNNDRDPCYSNSNSCGTNQSSPFKVQTTLNATIRNVGSDTTKKAKIHCLKESGDAKVYKMVRRLTIKRVDPVRNPATDVFKICLKSRTTASNPVEIVSVTSAKPAGLTGTNGYCKTQKYLGCNLDAAIKRICSY